MQGWFKHGSILDGNILCCRVSSQWQSTDWYHDPNQPDKSLLVEAATLRATRSLGSGIRLFDEFFPQKIESSDARKALLDMTRHTPRDFLQLLTHIQRFTTSSRPSLAEIKSGIRDYSIKYFLPEIQDELSGYASPDEISRMVTALGRVRKREFKMPELIGASSGSAKPLSSERIYEILEALFQCSALGNVKSGGSGNSIFTFKYRNRHSTFNESETIILHRGLWKALNLV
ncbi:P-loop ATPase, Sll1717 family [Mesorhizobium newzealandense]|uniref:P-loop ATPase, Sll1717 family n=1 Tax=Mesorhizobium newzealandense TaxID=1300302 RepID=A0ABW4ULS1_9HYPH